MGVVLEPGESQEELLKRFRREIAREGVLKDIRKRRWFVSKSEKRRIARAKALRRARRKQRKLQRKLEQG